MGFFHKALERLVPLLPRWVIASVARRYVAGETDDDAMSAVVALRTKGLDSTVDILGENARDDDEVAEVVRQYVSLLHRLKDERVSPHISIKPTHLGLRLGEDVSLAAARSIVETAFELEGFVQIDMEDSSTTDATIRLFRSLREDFDCVGMAIQACLRRSVDDVASLASLRPNLRICKGIYIEPEEIAFRDRDEIRESYLRLVDATLEVGGYPAIATHDRKLVDACLERTRDLDSSTHEYQMLAGVGHGRRPAILDAGSRIRIYVPYGPRWLEYSLRRLNENPRLLLYVVGGVLTGRAFFARR
jgi:proline dehydrogenase